MPFPRSTTIQTIIFDRKKWSVSKAKKWLVDHGKKNGSPDSTTKYHRFRQSDPSNFVKSSFRTINFGKSSLGIMAVIGMRKKKENLKKKVRLPRRIVMLGRCVEIQFVNGDIWKPRKKRTDLCASESGKTLWIVEVSRENKSQTPKSDLYEAFHGYYVGGVKTAYVGEPSKLKRSQKVDAIVYESDKWDGRKREYIHKFKKKPYAYTDNLKKPSFVKISGVKIKSEGITG